MYVLCVSAIRGQLVVYTQLHNEEINWPLEACLAKHPDAGFDKKKWGRHETSNVRDKL